MAVVGLPESEQLHLASGRGRWAVAACVLASSATLLDGTIANVALPSIGADFRGGVASLQWVISGFLLTLASLILLGGALGDRYGRRLIFVVGAIWFGAASLLCGLAPNLPALIAGRMLQGVGGALLTPTSLALLQASFVRKDRGAAVGVWSGLGGLAGAIGPFLGGWVIAGPGWRWAFLLNVPIVAVAVLASRALPESLEHGKHTPFDFLGAGLAIITLASLTWSLTEAPSRGWENPAVMAGFVAGLACAVAFVLRVRYGAHALVPRMLFRSRTFSVLNVVTFALYGALGSLFFLLVFQLQVSASWSPLAAGSALMPATALMLFGSARSGALATRIGPRLQLIVGPLLIAGALVLLSAVDEHANWWTDVLPGALIFGAGLVCFVAPLTASVMGSVDDEHVSIASGVNNAVARTASLAAIAVIPVVSGLTTAHGVSATTSAFHVAMLLAAALGIVAAGTSAIGLPRRTRCKESARQYICAVDGAPLQPELQPA